jgi:hypothetical protein
MGPIGSAPDVQNSSRYWRRDVAADSSFDHGGGGHRLSKYRVGTGLKCGVELDQIVREKLYGIRKAVPAAGICCVALIALGQQIDHQKTALSNCEVEPGRLADDGGVNLASALDCCPHARVLGLLAESEEDKQASHIHAPAVHDVPRSVQHGGDGGFGITGTAPVKAGSFDSRSERVPSPTGAGWNHVEVCGKHDGWSRPPAAHLHPDSMGAAYDIQPPPAGGLLDKDRQVGLLSTDRWNCDKLAKQVDLTRQGPLPGTSLFPCGRRSLYRTQIR